jgi:hypothetical protein
MSWDPPDPGEYLVPCGVFVAETRGQAKRMLLSEFDRQTDPEEFLDVRTRLLERDIDVGDISDALIDRLWGRVHEVEHHAGRPCDCPERG